MNSIFIHFNVTAALFFFRDSNKGLFVDNCFMMIGKQIPCSLLALSRVAHENCGCSRTTAIFFIAEKRIDRSSTPFRLSCWRRYGTRFEFVDNTDNTSGRIVHPRRHLSSSGFHTSPSAVSYLLSDDQFSLYWINLCMVNFNFSPKPSSRGAQTIAAWLRNGGAMAYIARFQISLF